MAFDNLVYPLATQKLTSSIEFSTTIIVMDSGAEQRNANWLDSRLKFDAATGVQTSSQLAQLIAFFRARKGAARGFLLKDWTDYQATNEACSGTADGTNRVFQLQKTYSDAGNADIRVITKPKSGTVTIYDNAVAKVETTDYTIDYTTGVVTFVSGHQPAAGHTVTWSGEFYVPVRFAGDELPVGLLFYKITSGGGEVASVQMIETRDFS